MTAPPATGSHSRSAVPTRALVLSAIGRDGRLRAGPLFAMAALLGHTDKAMRDCLARVARQGLLEHLSGRGKSAEYSVTEAGRASLDADLGWTAFAHRLDAGLEPWDGYWHLTGFEIPEARRGARDAIRNLLVELGAAPIQSGLYVYASDLSDFILQLASHLRVSDMVTGFVTDAIEVGGHRREEDLVNRLWPLAELAGRYAGVERRLAAVVEQAPLADGDRLAALMLAATLEVEAVLRDDPLLPVELLGAAWAGSRARAAFMAAHSAASAHSELFRNSRLMQAYTAEIQRSVAETSASFWDRWFPRLIDAYQARLPASAVLTEPATIGDDRAASTSTRAGYYTLGPPAAGGPQVSGSLGEAR